MLEIIITTEINYRILYKTIYLIKLLISKAMQKIEKSNVFHIHFVL